ncbi:2-oxoisovalerate dehydrogenase subunit beta [Planctomycetes bacterium Pla86]|uniref:3-methyl-2-oxobutanoate dehydrogenase (2-methylpropanoyl-transferring) n=1 Tax=Engelhardtia mirabilis TaxID=2528011 RepID=A0A518BRF3_9BACT|nr:2-oxoisovalerate dehydrogenase subunit beta [Planctomycetes bacterium Pla133]QDV03869.1 2-oxoisovalerate dehydrogenase subunit beta [Planctomycetes bacterium Pla86]
MQAVEQRLDDYLRGATAAARPLDAEAPIAPGRRLTALQAVKLFEDQCLSRSLDVAARELKKTNDSFYTISSAGHEQNGIVGTLLRPTDPCFLHYRSGALMMSRLRQLRGSTPAFDTLLSLCASSDEPVSGGRHKVWGSREAWTPPQTSTIASQVPKAVGMAFALSRARRLGLHRDLPDDSIVACSFGDASSNHASALTGINAARYSLRKGNPTPILFICEDNRIGISVETPKQWIADHFSRLQHLSYFEATGSLAETWDTVHLAIHTCRATHAPVFLHLRTVRLWGHAGSDVETGYRSLDEIESIEELDPLLANARELVESGAASPGTLQAIRKDAHERVMAAAREAASRPHLETRAQVMAPLAPYDEPRTRASAAESVGEATRRACFGGKLPEEQTAGPRRTLAAHVNAALTDAMLKRGDMLMMGEDVGKKGGVYGVTAGLQERFGTPRVFDTLLDETTILGVAQGAAQLGFLPVPEIQYLAYLHNAIDQLRGEACSTRFFSNGQWVNPMVVRIAGLAYQKGFGGHFHNDNAIAALREIPGIAIACPSRGDDAARLLRGSLALAAENERVVVFLEPIALYHERDLYEEGDGAWLSDYPLPGDALLPGEVGVHDAEASDLLIVSYANGLRLSLRAARQLEREHGLRARVLDLRWLAPLPFAAVAEHAAQCGKLLIVDECRASGGVADALAAAMVERDVPARVRSVRAADTYIPLGPSTRAVLVTEEQILEGALELTRDGEQARP